MTTIKEVADHAGVSIATVSRVINRNGYVSPDLVARVEQAMQALHYHPSELARGLRSQRTQVVGVLIPQLDQPFFGSLTYAIERTLFAHDYRTLICSAEESLERETSYVDMFLRQRVDGVIMVPTGYSGDNVRRLLEKDVPVVMVDRDTPEITAVHRVLLDNYRGGYVGMRYLIELGHERIGVISAPAYSDPMSHRLRGVRDALRGFDLPVQAELFISDTLSQFEMGYSAFKTLMALPQRPTAIFALTDVMAVGVMHAAYRAGMRVPEQLSVMGFDNIPLASYFIPELTTVAQPIYEMGERASELLTHCMQTHCAEPQTIMLTPELIVRQSALRRPV